MYGKMMKSKLNECSALNALKCKKATNLNDLAIAHIVFVYHTLGSRFVLIISIDSDIGFAFANSMIFLFVCLFVAVVICNCCTASD